MTLEQLNKFKKELASLLGRYNVSIGLVADSGSDWYGITGEKIVVSGIDDVCHVLSNGTWVDCSDLEKI